MKRQDVDFNPAYAKMQRAFEKRRNKKAPKLAKTVKEVFAGMREYRGESKVLR